MRGRRLGRRLVRAGKQAARSAAPGIAATLGTLAVSGPSYGATAIPPAPPITNCVPDGTGSNDCIGTGGGTPFTAAPFTVPTDSVSIPAFTGSQFYAFEIPADEHSLEIGVALSGIDPNLNGYLLVTTGLDPTQQVAVPLINFQPGSSTLAGSLTITQPSGALTLGGGGGGPATVIGGPGNSTLAAGPDLSYANLLIYQTGGDFLAQGSGESTISGIGGGNNTIGAVGGNSTILSNLLSTILAGGGNNTVFAGGASTVLGIGESILSTILNIITDGENSTIVAGGGNTTILAGGPNITFLAGGENNSTIFAGGTSQTVSGSPQEIPATILGGAISSFLFDGDPPADDVIVGIDLENPDASLNGGVISFSEPVDPPAVPEPATLGLFATALAGLALLRRRRS